MAKAARSPFPGMDPYLEQFWYDIHVRLIAEISIAIEQQLPEDLAAKAEKDVTLSRLDARPQTYRGDVTITETTQFTSPGGGTAVLVDPDADVEVIEIEPRPHRYIEIRPFVGSGDVVTVIEVLSPTNKEYRASSEAFAEKAKMLHDAGVNFVEIDLIRGPRTHLHWNESKLRPENRAPYYAAVWQARRHEQIVVMPLHLDKPIPNIPIPLRAHEEPVSLPLQEVLDRIYAEGRYWRTDYSVPPVPPLQGEDAAWAEQRLLALRSAM